MDLREIKEFLRDAGNSMYPNLEEKTFNRLPYRSFFFCKGVNSNVEFF